MRFTRLKVVLLCCLISLETGSAQWVIKRPNSMLTGDYARMCYTGGDKIAWMVGYGGAAACSVDSGVTWTSVSTGVTNDLKGVFFLNQSTGWIVGGEDPWGNPCDGGGSWSTQRISHDIYYDVQFLDESNGWVAGFDSTYQSFDSGAVLRTTDGGKHWTRIPVETGWVWCLNFLSPSTGYLGAEPRGVLGGDILKTTDGGDHWSMYTLPFVHDNRRVVDLHMADSLRGCCIVPNEGVKYTSDGGSHWNAAQGFSAFPELNHVAYTGGKTWIATQNLPYASGPLQAVHRSTDDGITWTPVFSSMLTGGFMDVKFRDSRSGGVLTEQGMVLRTSDGGVHWNEDRFTSLDAVSASVLVAGANGGQVSRSETGGVSWVAQQLPTGAEISSVEFISGARGWAVSNDGVYRTTNGGVSWEQMSLKPLTTIVALSDNELIGGYNEPLVSPQGVIANKICHIVRSTDAGATWQDRFVDSLREGPTSFSFLNASEGWAACPNFAAQSHPGTVILHTTDGGRSWGAFPEIANPTMNSMRFVGDSTGYALSQTIRGAPAITATNDGGRSWHSIFQTYAPLTDLAFFDAMHGWACGTLGKSYRTLDGGVTWKEQPSVTNRTLYAMRFTSASTGYAVGADRIVLKNANAASAEISQKAHPASFELNQNYPNPFNPSTRIRYSLPYRSHVWLEVFNPLGQRVARLIDRDSEAGDFETVFDAGRLASGVYFYRLQARPLTPEDHASSTQTLTRSLVFVR